MAFNVVTDLQFKLSTLVSDTPSANGGEMSNTLLTSANAHYIWNHITPEDRQNGITRMRKFFVHNINSEGYAYINSGVFPPFATNGDSMFLICRADNPYYGLESDLSIGEAAINCTLASDVVVGDESITVTAESADVFSLGHSIFSSGSTVRISDMSSAAYYTVVTRSISGASVTLYLKPQSSWLPSTDYAEAESVIPTSDNGHWYMVVNDAGSSGTTEPNWPIDGSTVTDGDLTWRDMGLYKTAQANYTAANNGRVAGVLNLNQLVPWASTPQVTSSGGSYDASTYPVNVTNRGTIAQTWTLTFTGATTFTASGDTVGTIDSGSTGTDFAPINPASSEPYFTLDSAGFSGTFSAGDVIQFETTPSAASFWLKVVVPAGSAAPDSRDSTAFVVFGEALI